MAVQMTRSQYEAKYGSPPPAPAPVKMTRDQYEAKYNTPAAPTPPPPTSLGQKLLNAGSAVTKFLGGKAVADTFGSEIAKIGASPETKQYLSSTQPTPKQTIGSGLQLGANFIPGAGVGAPLVSKVAAGAATGYAMDVGSKLQNNSASPLKPGMGTAVGTVLPIAGKVTGFGNTASKAKKFANTMETQNLRMTPVEKQNVVKQGKNIANYLSKKKLVGTPERRYSQVAAMYDDMERKITRVVDGSGVNVAKADIIRDLQNIPAKYADNLSEYDSVVAKVERIIETLKKNKGDMISATSINTMKKNEWQNAYAKNNTDVINDVSNEVGHVLKTILDKRVKGLEPLNKEYGTLITAKRQLFKAQSRNQSGIFGRLIGVVTGTAAGSALGGPAGAAVGGFFGDRAANMTATPIRSALGAGAQIASEGVKNLRVPGASAQPIRKSLLQGLQSSRPQDSTPQETERSPQSQEKQSSQNRITEDQARKAADMAMNFGPGGAAMGIKAGAKKLGGVLAKQAADKEAIATKLEQARDYIITELQKSSGKLDIKLEDEVT